MVDSTYPSKALAQLQLRDKRNLAYRLDGAESCGDGRVV